MHTYIYIYIYKLGKTVNCIKNTSPIFFVTLAKYLIFNKYYLIIISTR